MVCLHSITPFPSPWKVFSGTICISASSFSFSRFSTLSVFPFQCFTTLWSSHLIFTTPRPLAPPFQKAEALPNISQSCWCIFSQNLFNLSTCFKPLQIQSVDSYICMKWTFCTAPELWECVIHTCINYLLSYPLLLWLPLFRCLTGFGLVWFGGLLRIHPGPWKEKCMVCFSLFWYCCG